MYMYVYVYVCVCTDMSHENKSTEKRKEISKRQKGGMEKIVSHRKYEIIYS